MATIGIVAIALVLPFVTWPRIESEYRWRRMVRLTVDDPPGSQFYWREIAARCYPELRPLATGRGAREKLEVFVDKFGREGPVADYRWVVSFPDATLPRHLGWAPYWGGPRVQSARVAQCTISEMMCRRLLREPKLIDRYWQVVRFSGRILARDPDFQLSNIGLIGGQCRDGFRDGPPDEYWWWARNFILLAHCTGRDDLWRSANPDELDERFDEWLAWFQTNENRLGFDESLGSFRVCEADQLPGAGAHAAVRKLPFDDWVGDLPDADDLDRMDLDQIWP